MGGLIIGTLIFPVVILFFPKKKRRVILSDVVHYSWILFVKIMSGLHLIGIQKTLDLKNLCGTIIIANHPTLLDIVLLISMIPHCVCVVKGALAHNFFIRHIIRRLYLVNDDDLSRFLNEAETCLADGLNVIIFPEGTRTDFSKKTPRLFRGFAHLAVRTRVPILPVKIQCTPQILGKGQKWFDVGTRRVMYAFETRSMIKIPPVRGQTPHVMVKKITQQATQELFEKND